MNELSLPGCRTEPLGSYLMGLGTWRAVVRLLDKDAQAHWSAGSLVLTTRISNLNELVNELVQVFAPIPAVSPWNEGSGFAGTGKSKSAEQTIERLRQSGESRLASVREAIIASDKVIEQGRTLGLGGKKSELWDKARKAEIISLARNLLPDDALPWVDAAVVLGRDGEPNYNRLLGTGANFGRLDLSTTYLDRAIDVVEKPDQAKLHAALAGDESLPYERGTVGQFDPGRAGGVQSSPFEKADEGGFINPWAFVLTIEGTVLFAAAVVRRFGANTVEAAVPFVVRASTAGSPDMAADEQGLAEIWTPIWERPARFTEVEHLLSEGRAEWRGSAARTGLDFVRAVSSLGVDRGLSSFTRHVVVERLGQSPLAVPAGRVSVQPREAVRLLEELDSWLSRLRGRDLPSTVESELRAVDAAEYAVAAGGGAQALQQVVVALGRLHEAASRSGRARGLVPPLRLRRPSKWLGEMDDGSRELWLAASLASGRDGGDQSGPTLRELLTPVTIDGKGYVDWSGRPSPVSTGVDVIAALAQAHRHRAMVGTVPELGEQKPGDGTASVVRTVLPAVRGVLSAFHYGLRADLADVAALAAGAIDEELLADLLRGLMLANWTGASTTWRTERPWHSLPPTLALLAPFFAAEPLMIRRSEEEELREPVVFRPGSDWIPRLISGRGTDDVIEDARRRLVIAGFDRVVRPTLRSDGVQLAAALLVPMSTHSRVRALRAVTDLPDQRTGNHQREGEAA